jgi:hypothetical protein
LVDALGSGPSGGNTVGVRVPFWAPFEARFVSRYVVAKIIFFAYIPPRMRREENNLHA